MISYFLAIQSDSVLDTLESVLLQHKEIRHVKYSTDAQGKPLEMNPQIMQSLCQGFSGGEKSFQLTISHVPITIREISQMKDIFTPGTRLKSLVLSDCQFVSLYILS